MIWDCYSTALQIAAEAFVSRDASSRSCANAGDVGALSEPQIGASAKLVMPFTAGDDALAFLPLLIALETNPRIVSELSSLVCRSPCILAVDSEVAPSGGAGAGHGGSICWI